MNRINLVHLGPMLYRVELTEQQLKLINELSNSADIDMRTELVGEIDSELAYDEITAYKFFGIIEQDIKKCLQQWVKMKYDKDMDYKIVPTALWKNEMHAGEYNQIHNHDGHISFVLYTYIDERIYEEKPAKPTADPGTIEFMYGKTMGGFMEQTATSPITQIAHKPKAGELFVFASGLFHRVQEFKTPGATRISIAGNTMIVNSFELLKETNV